MTLENLKIISETENEAAELIAKTDTQCANIVDQAKKEAKKQIEEATKIADEKLREAIIKADAIADGDLKKELEKTKAECEILKVNAQKNVPKAIEVIVGKVKESYVNS